MNEQNNFLSNANGPMLALGLSLLTAGQKRRRGESTPLDGVLSTILQQQQQQAVLSQRQKEFDLQQQRFGFDQQQEQNLQDRFAKNLALQQQQEQRQQDFINRQLQAGKSISQSLGEEGSMVNNFQGSGLLGNMQQIDPLQRARIYAAQSLAESGDLQGALSQLPQMAKQSYGQPIAAVDAQGRPTYIMANDQGEIKQIDNYAPIPKKGTSLSVGPDGSVQFDQGGMAIGGNIEPTNSVNTELQKDVLGLTDSLARLRQVGDAYNKSYLTYLGGARGSFGGFLDKAFGNIPASEKQFLKGQTEFNNSVEQFFNQYRKQITGAAAALGELGMLRKSILNKDLTPTQFEAAFKQFTDLSETLLGIKQKLIAQGIPADSKQMGELIDREYLNLKNQNQKTESSADPLGLR